MNNSMQMNRLAQARPIFKSSTSLLHSKENVGATREEQTNKEIKNTCVKRFTV